MRRIILPLALAISALTVSCNTTKKLYEAQQYDQVILTVAPKICQGEARHDEVVMVADSYHKANQADHERIMGLKATGQPDVWPEIYERYTSMEGRNQALSCLSPDLKKIFNYADLDLDDELTGARNKAEAYLAAKINLTLGTATPDLEQVDRMIRQLERVNPGNSRINELKVKALAKRYGDLQRLKHVEVFQRLVGPDRDETVTFKESKDGLTATVTDHKLSKTATVKGKVNFIDPQNKQLLLSLPFEVSSKFEHNYSTVEGSQQACSEQTLERLKQQPIPFPTDESMVRDALKELDQWFTN